MLIANYLDQDIYNLLSSLQYILISKSTSEKVIKLAQTNDNDYIIPCPEIAPCLDQCAVQYSAVYSGSGNLWSPTLKTSPPAPTVGVLLLTWRHGITPIAQFPSLFQNASRILLAKAYQKFHWSKGVSCHCHILKHSCVTENLSRSG